MKYRSIATLLHDPKTDMDTLRFAIDAARKWDAHLHVLCAGINLTDPGFYYSGAQPSVVEKNLEIARDDALALRTKVTKIMEAEAIKWEAEPVVIMTMAINSFVSRHMRYADCVILPSPYAKGRVKADEAIFEACLFGAGVPVLVAPKGASLPVGDLKPMIAWDGSAEALSAARALKPLLSDKVEVNICVIDPPSSTHERSDPGGRLGQALKRTGAQVHISVLSRTSDKIATQLSRHAVSVGADLIVMGGYGHSRLREAVIGGVTRSMLRTTSHPILMAH